MKKLILKLMLVLAACGAQGQGTIAFHSGANDPTTEGFRFEDEPPTTVGAIINDSGINAWQMDHGQAVVPFGSYYQQLFTVSQNVEVNEFDWVLTVTAKSLLNGGPQNQVNLYTGSELFELGFNWASIGDLISVQGSSIQTVLIKGETPSYHTYQLDYHIATDSADLYIDGLEMLEGITGQVAPGGGNGGLTWGEINGGEANWSLVSLAAIPEPSSFRIAFLLGFVGLFSNRLKHSKSRKREL